MILVPSITDEVRIYINQKLISIAKENNVKILFAIESGSRAWGFPSTNSDYDVRFVYVRFKDDYLSVKQYRDVIETDCLNDSFLGVPLDLNGWDIRKALQLSIKSNAVLFEWLKSPIKYFADESVVDDILKFAKDVADIGFIKGHYYNLMINAWKQIEESSEGVKLKLYCYALRPALALQWIEQFGDIPPMDMNSLIKGLVKDRDLGKEIFELIALKATAKESDTISRNLVIDSFIQTVLTEPLNMDKKPREDETFIKADSVFRKIIKC